MREAKHEEVFEEEESHEEEKDTKDGESYVAWRGKRAPMS